ncbi:polyketide synthase dehydratase domain-containing protein, partial [Micromonospora sp. DH15]|nr:polyketide synthase dehydratase domain-containing protein [Micromonospora sp. DH15]
MQVVPVGVGALPGGQFHLGVHLVVTGPHGAQPAPPAAGLAAWPPPHARPADLTGFYAGLAADGYAYGPAFQGLRAVWTGDDEVYAEVELPAGQRADADRYHLH